MRSSKASPKSSSIEEQLKNKQVEVGTVNDELQKAFRDKFAKHNTTVAKHFEEIPRHEFVIDSHKCSHVGKILKQGRLYLTPNYVLFFASVLGSKVKKVIPFEKVIEIKKDSGSFIHSIEIHFKFKKFTFANFSHREKAYEHIMMQWQQYKDGRPFQITIPLEDKKEEDESESASLSSQVADEPGMEPIQLETVWGGNHTNDGAILADAPEGADQPTKKKSLKAMTIAKIPTFYSTGEDGEKTKCSCFPCFR